MRSRLLLLFFLGQVVSHHAAGRCAHDGMMASHVPCYGPNGGSLEATLCLGGYGAGQKHDAKK